MSHSLQIVPINPRPAAPGWSECSFVASLRETVTLAPDGATLVLDFRRLPAVPDSTLGQVLDLITREIPRIDVQIVGLRDHQLKLCEYFVVQARGTLH